MKEFELIERVNKGMTKEEIFDFLKDFDGLIEKENITINIIEDIEVYFDVYIYLNSKKIKLPIDINFDEDGNLFGCTVYRDDLYNKNEFDSFDYEYKK